jgi:hypothetical protein
MKTTLNAKPLLLSILTFSCVMSLASIATAQSQRVCIVNDSNQVVCGRPASDRDYNNANPDRSRQNTYNDINNIYQEVLGRTVDNRALATWTRAINNGRPLKDIRQEVARSSEAQGKINQIYQEVLGRNADPAGMQTWTNNLINGDSLKDVRRALERSDEARNRNKPR